MLRTSLDAHPEIVCLTEMFNPDYTLDHSYTENTPEAVILNQYIFCERQPEIKAVGFCIHRLQARFGHWPQLWEQLTADQTLRVIHLQRENLLRRYFSYQIRPRKGQRLGRDLVNDPPPPFAIQPAQLIADFSAHEAALNQFKALFAHHPTLTVTYEALCQQYDAIMTQIQLFLGVTPLPLTPQTQQRHHLPLQDWITNYAALKTHFTATPWAKFFD